MLELSDYSVARAYNATTALDAASRLKPVVALIDINLGAANGVELVSRLKEHHPGIICVMVTGGADIDSAIEAVRHGAYDYLRKPVSRDEILASLSRCFDRHRLEQDKFAAEQRLRESEQKFRAIFDQSPSSITLTDLEGRYRLVNSRFEDWTGVPRGEAIGRTPSELFPARQADSWERPDTATLKHGENIEYEWRVSVPGQRELHLAIAKFPVLNQDGGTIGVGTIANDISTLRETQAQLAEVQKMEAVGRLTGGMAHEFNNLLQAMTGYLELLDMGLQESRDKLTGPDTLNRHLAGAMRACETAGDITSSLLAYGRKQPLQASPIDLSELVMEMDDIVRGVLTETVAFRTVINCALWRALADKAQMQSALINLVLNARDAMADGGSLTIEIANAPNSGPSVKSSPADYVRLSVADTGCGIAPELLDRVFEPFYTTKDIGKGTGLGLSMVYGLVTQSGGFVDIDSTPGKGTRIDLYLPRHLENKNGAGNKSELRKTG